MFIRRFLRADGWELRDFRVVVSPSGRGSAEQFVRERFPGELHTVRTKRREQAYLVVMVDGDRGGVTARNTSLVTACTEQGIPPPGDTEKVLVCVPTWNIETWMAYLDGDPVDETNKNYPRLPKPSDCAPAVSALVKMCRHRTLRVPAPASLEDACTSYRRVFR